LDASEFFAVELRRGVAGQRGLGRHMPVKSMHGVSVPDGVMHRHRG
jgi:hypothetical protein